MFNLRSITYLPLLSIISVGIMLMPILAYSSNDITVYINTWASKDVDNNSAVLIALYSNALHSDNISIWFEYGTSNNLGRKSRVVTKKLERGNVATEVEVTGLKQNTIYFYKAFSEDARGDSEGIIRSFKTRGTGSSASGGGTASESSENDGSLFLRPVVRTKFASHISESSAILHGNAKKGSDDDETIVWFQWGVRQSLGNITPPQTFNTDVTDFSFPLSGLKPNITYYYRAVAENSNGISRGAILTFISTSGSQGPKAKSGVLSVVTGKVNNIKATSAKMTGFALTHDEHADGWFEWGRTTMLGNLTSKTALKNKNTTNIYSETLTGLSGNTKYYYRAVAEDASGIKKGALFSFVTLSKISPAVSDSGVVMPTKTGAGSISISQEIANLSFPNGTRKITSATENQMLQYTLVVHNAVGVISDVSVRNKLSSHVEFIKASNGGLYDKDTREVIWNLEYLSKDEPRILTVNALVKKADTNVIAENYASIENSANFAESGITTALINLSPVFLTIDTDSAKINAGRDVNYTVKYVNESGERIFDASIKFILPRGISFKENSDNGQALYSTANYEIGTIESNQSGEIIVNAQFDSNVSDEIELTAVGVLSFKDLNLNKQKETSAHVSHLASKSIFNSMSASVISAGSVWPTSVIGWLALFLVLLVIFAVLLKIYGLFFAIRQVEKRKTQEAPDIVL